MVVGIMLSNTNGIFCCVMEEFMGHFGLMPFCVGDSGEVTGKERCPAGPLGHQGTQLNGTILMEKQGDDPLCSTVLLQSISWLSDWKQLGHKKKEEKKAKGLLWWVCLVSDNKNEIRYEPGSPVQVTDPQI